MANLYRPSAHLYDLDPRAITRDDIPFYRSLAKQCGGSVLELGCGTGRVTIPLLQDGHAVWALDLSEEMLGELHAKSKDLPATKLANLHAVHDDMAAFDLGRQFELIVAPFRGFQALTQPEHQRACLRCVKRHLARRGRFVMHVFKPKVRFDRGWVRPESFDWEVVDPRSGRIVRRYERRKHIDLDRQVLEVDLVYRAEDESSDVVERLALSYFYEEQMRALLLECGFRIAEEMGYFDRRPISEGPELIFVCE